LGWLRLGLWLGGFGWGALSDVIALGDRWGKLAGMVGSRFYGGERALGNLAYEDLRGATRMRSQFY
jgi:hypothetical protein